MPDNMTMADDEILASLARRRRHADDAPWPVGTMVEMHDDPENIGRVTSCQESPFFGGLVVVAEWAKERIDYEGRPFREYAVRSSEVRLCRGPC